MNWPQVASLFAIIALSQLVDQAKSACQLEIYRSHDGTALKLQLYPGRYIYVGLVKRPEFPAIQFHVDGQQVILFRDDGCASVQNLPDIEHVWPEQLVNQFRQYETAHFNAKPFAYKLLGTQLEPGPEPLGSFVETRLTHRATKLALAEANFELLINLNYPQMGYFEFNSPLNLDLLTRIEDSTCKARVFFRGQEVAECRTIPIGRQLRGRLQVASWNPLNRNSWTLFGPTSPSSSDHGGAQLSPSRTWSHELFVEPPEPSDD